MCSSCPLPSLQYSPLDPPAMGILDGDVGDHGLSVGHPRRLRERFAGGRRERLAHRVGHPQVAVHRGRALRGHPLDGFPARDVVAVAAAGIELDTYTTGLTHIDVTHFPHAVLARPERGL